jgi:D-xylose 1-dehydrogenase
MAIYPSLAQRPVLITGGGGGIGAAMVAAFASQGARVAFIDRDPAAAAQVIAAVTPDAAFQPVYEICDLTDIAEAQAATLRLAELCGPFRVLVNNAGNDAVHPIEQVTPAQFDDCIAVNLRHQFFLAQAVAPGMVVAGGGSIINLGSISWMIGAANIPIYAAAKAGVEGLTRALARDLGGKGIRVNSIAPGWVLTERQLAKGAADPAKFDAYLARQCIKEHLQPGDVAELALWLAADESRRCTASTWFVDGGCQ